MNSQNDIASILVPVFNRLVGHYGPYEIFFIILVLSFSLALFLYSPFYLLKSLREGGFIADYKNRTSAQKAKLFLIILALIALSLSFYRLVVLTTLFDFPIPNFVNNFFNLILIALEKIGILK